MNDKDLIVLSKKSFILLCLVMCFICSIIISAIIYFCLNYSFSKTQMSVDAFIGVIATLIGGLITFALGFQIMNTIEVNKKLYQFEESVEKKNRDHISEIDKKSSDLESKLVSKIDDNEKSIDKRIKSIEKSTESSINEIDVNFNQLSELGYRLEVESLDTRVKLLFSFLKSETKAEYKIQYTINLILVRGAYNKLVKRVPNMNPNWVSINLLINNLARLYKTLINDPQVIANSPRMIDLKNNVQSLLSKHEKFSAPYLKCINILFYIIKQKEEGLEIEILKTNVEIRMELFKQELEEYISKNR